MNQTFCFTTLLFLSCFKYTQSIFFAKSTVPMSEVKYVRHCETSNDTKQRVTTKLFRYSHAELGLNATWDILEPFDRTYKIRLDVKKWTEAGWQNNFFNLERSEACKSLTLLLGNFWKEVLRQANIDPHCPLKPGHYELYNFHKLRKDNESPSSPLVILPGRFLCTFRVIKNKKNAACIEMEIIFRERYFYEK